jgi:hypothetical protein
MRNLKGALASTTLRSQFGVLAGLRVKLVNGLPAPMGRPTSVPVPRDTVTCFMITRIRRRPVGN